MERILNYTVSLEGISPAKPLCGGYQGEHRAAALVFTPDTALSEELALRKEKGGELSVVFSLVTEAGERFSEDKRPAEALSEPFFLTRKMTDSGLDSTVILRITETDIKGECSDFLRAAVPIYFMKGEGYGEEASEKEQADVLEKKTAEALLLIEGRSAEAQRIAEEGIDRMQSVQALSAEQLKKTLAAAGRAEAFATRAQKDAELSAEALASAVAETEKAKKYCLAAGSYRETAGQEAAAAENAADKAEELLVMVEEKAVLCGDIAAQNLNYAETCKEGAAAAAAAADTANTFAEAAEEYSLSAVNEVKNYINTTFGDMETAIDSILAVQQGFIGGEGE